MAAQVCLRDVHAASNACESKFHANSMQIPMPAHASAGGFESSAPWGFRCACDCASLRAASAIASAMEGNGAECSKSAAYFTSLQQRRKRASSTPFPSSRRRSASALHSSRSGCACEPQGERDSLTLRPHIGTVLPLVEWQDDATRTQEMSRLDHGRNTETNKTHFGTLGPGGTRREIQRRQHLDQANESN
eukprot:6189598-Pleurochrysis_carterae.AAC.2